MSRLSKLTPDQENRLPEIRDEWIRIGLSTEPADRGAAERHVDEAYRVAGLDPPKIKTWWGSPLAGAIEAARTSIVGLDGQLKPQIPDPFGARVLEQVSDRAWEQVKIWEHVSEDVMHLVRWPTFSQVGKRVLAQVWEKVADHFPRKISDQVRHASYGSHEAASLSYYAAWREFGVEAVRRLDPLMGLARTCGWWWPFEDAVILTERPCLLHLDERSELHDESGPAILYPDGWGLAFWNGVKVPRKIIESPESLTARDIDEEENAEVRRVMIERYGEERYLEHAGARTIADDEHDQDVNRKEAGG